MLSLSLLVLVFVSILWLSPVLLLRVSASTSALVSLLLFVLLLFYELSSLFLFVLKRMPVMITITLAITNPTGSIISMTISSTMIICVYMITIPTTISSSLSRMMNGIQITSSIRVTIRCITCMCISVITISMILRSIIRITILTIINVSMTTIMNTIVRVML